MNDYEISCCSTVDLTPERLQERNLRYVCFRYQISGVEFLIGATIGSHTGPGTMALFFGGDKRQD